MSTFDTAMWRCPMCGHEVEAERVVDATFVPRVDAHKAGHAVPPKSESRRSDGEA